METVPTAAFAILTPAQIDDPLVVGDVSEPACILFAVLLPMMLFSMFTDVAAPEILIPMIAPAIVAVVPPDLKPPNVLFLILIAPVDEEWTPTINACVVVEVATRLEPPVEDPIKFP